MNSSTWQNPGQLIVAQAIKNIINYSVAELRVTKKQTYLQLLIGLRKKKTVEIKKRLPPNLTKNLHSHTFVAMNELSSGFLWNIKQQPLINKHAKNV